MRLVRVIGYEKSSIGQIGLTMGTARIPITVILPVTSPFVAFTAAVYWNAKDFGKTQKFYFRHPGAIYSHLTDVMALLLQEITNQFTKQGKMPLAASYCV